MARNFYFIAVEVTGGFQKGKKHDLIFLLERQLWVPVENGLYGSKNGRRKTPNGEVYRLRLLANNEDERMDTLAMYVEGPCSLPCC